MAKKNSPEQNRLPAAPGPAGLRAVVPVLSVAALVLVLIPILLVGGCAHPFGDDYAYSVFFHQALEGGTSLLGALAHTVKRYFFGWQGTYSAAVLMALQPGVWSEQAYLLTPAVMLAMLILPTACLTHTLLRRWLGLRPWEWLAVTAGLLLSTILFQPSTMQAFFWWNGAVYYTFFYGLMLLLVNCVIRLRLAPSHPRWLMAASLLLAVIIGGGNYVTGLFSCLLLWGYGLLCLLWDRRRLWQPVSLALVLTVCFLINMLAPGNQVRQAASQGMNIPATLASALLQALRDSAHWLNLPILCFFLCLIPVLWRGMGHTRFTFPFPAVVTVVLFLALASQNAPHFYALASEGPGRLRNIVYDSWLWLLLLGGGYWLGWLRHRFFPKKELPPVLSKGLVCLGLFLALAGVTFHFSGTSAGQCVQALSDGSAQAYDLHMNHWAEQLRSDEEEIVLQRFDNPPELLCLFNLTDNPENFANIAAANYYGKKSVIALPSGSGMPTNKD